jgi:hypothetical protein
MKHLQDYIIEQAQVNEGSTSKSISFNFKDLENGKETLDSLKDKEGVTIDEEEEKLTVEVTTDNVDKLGTVQDILQQFCQTIRNSDKRSSDEQYAQKTVEFEKKVGELNDALDEIANPDDKDDNGGKKEGEDE